MQIHFWAIKFQLGKSRFVLERFPFLQPSKPPFEKRFHAQTLMLEISSQSDIKMKIFNLKLNSIEERCEIPELM